MWMYRGNLSLRTFFDIFFFIRKFSNFRICSNLVGFNRINSIVILLNVQNQFMVNCAFPTCTVSRNTKKYDGISLFKSEKVNTIPLGENICWMYLASIVK